MFIGPMFVHQRRTYETYFHFVSEILKHQKALASLNAIGTDGEEQLSNAFGTVFPGAVKLLCVVHKRDNIQAKLRQLAVPERLSIDILDSIFGYQLGDTFFKGLLLMPMIRAGLVAKLEQFHGQIGTIENQVECSMS